jgi:hypothetical protein
MGCFGLTHAYGKELTLMEAEHTRARVVHLKAGTLPRFWLRVVLLQHSGGMLQGANCSLGSPTPVGNLGDPHVFFRLEPDAIGRPALLSESSVAGTR